MGDLGAGLGYLVEGQKWVARNGRWWGFGLLPGLITLVLYAVALFSLVFWADDLTTWATPFADSWSSHWQALFRAFLIVLLFAIGLKFAVVIFTAVTLLIGEPFYDSLSEQVDISEDGTAPESALPLWRQLWGSAIDSLAVLLRMACYGVMFFVLGFFPILGQTVVPAVSFGVTGFFLTEELTAIAFARRGLRLGERLALLRGRRALALGFGVPLALCFLVPLVAVFLMPGAVAGATLLTRDLIATPMEPRNGTTPEPVSEALRP